MIPDPWTLVMRWAAPVLGGLAVLAVLGLLLHNYGQGRFRAGAASRQAEVSQLTASLGTCRANTTSLQVALDGQSAQVRAVSEAGARATAAAAEVVEKSRGLVADAQRKAGRVLAPLGGGDTCVRLLEVDARLMETTSAQAR